MAGVALRLLVVEDDDHIRTALRWALEDEGYDVAEARLGRGRTARGGGGGPGPDGRGPDAGFDGRLRRHPRGPPLPRPADHRGQRPRRHQRHRRGPRGRRGRLRDQAVRGQGDQRPAARPASPIGASRGTPRRPTPRRSSWTRDPDAPLVLREARGHGAPGGRAAAPDADGVPAAVRAGRCARAGSSAGRPCSSGCGSTGSSATSGSSTSTCGGCARRWSATRARPSSWSPSAASGTGWIRGEVVRSGRRGSGRGSSSGSPSAPCWSPGCSSPSPSCWPAAICSTSARTR